MSRQLSSIVYVALKEQILAAASLRMKIRIGNNEPEMVTVVFTSELSLSDGKHPYIIILARNCRSKIILMSAGH
jgi:hypothetical protein